MTKIIVLDEQTANQIAAGEVVERPASVVKELVENSLDAGARRVVVEIEGGGRDLIRVTDDGCGMSAQDAQLSLQRHATSKIRVAADLLSVGTMGFRGEAIPSIASVSHFELITREAAEMAGYRLYVEGGTLKDEGECGSPPGTRITVRNLFYNVPARLKYLKASATEMGHISDVLTRLALAHPDVAFRFHAGQAQVFATPGSGNSLDTIATLLGREVARELMPVEYHEEAVAIRGFIGRPAVARAGRNHQHFFVNRRAIRTLQLRYALEEAYAHLLPTGRYPVCILFLEVAPAQVDVNVHPAKAEVRFEREREVRGAVYKAARQALGASLLIPGTTISPDGEVAIPDRTQERQAAYQSAFRIDRMGAAAPGVREAPATYATPNAAPSTLPGDGLQSLLLRRTLDEAEQGSPAAAWSTSPEAPAEAHLVRNLRPLGQVHRSYIACDGPQGLYLIDQHAAHERIFFERLMQGATAPVKMQTLLFPITLDLPPAHMALWRENEALFGESGFLISPFGGSTLLIKAMPATLNESHAARLVSDFLDRLQEERLAPGTGPLERRRRVLAALAACKAAIKAKDALQPEDVEALLADLAACKSPATCPHGRPTVICIAIPELEKRFKR